MARPATQPRPTSFRRLRQAERWGIVALVVAGLGAGTWGVVRLAHPAKPRPATGAAPRRQPVVQEEEGSTPNVVYVVDSTLAPTRADTSDAHLYSVDQEPADAALATPTKQPVDSVAMPAVPAPAPADSAAAPSPAP